MSWISAHHWPRSTSSETSARKPPSAPRMPWRIYWVRSAGREIRFRLISQNQMAKFIDCTGNIRKPPFRCFWTLEIMGFFRFSQQNRRFSTGGVQVWRCDEKGHEQGNGCYRRLHRERGRGTVDHKGHGTADLWVKSVCEYGLDYQRLKVSCFLHRAY